MLKDDVIGILGRILDPEEFDPRFKNPDRVSDAPLATPVVQGRETIPLKPLTLSELEGFPYLTTMSDRTAAGGQLVGIGDKSLAYPVNLTGGQDFMRDFTENPNLWASGASVVPKMVNAARELEAEYGRQPVLMPWTMTPTGSDFAGMTGKTMFSYASENMPQTFKNEVDGYMKLHVPDWKGIDNPESGAQFDALPDRSRKIVQRDMDTKFRNVGGTTLPQARIAIADQSQLKQPVMGFKNVGLIDTSVDALAGAGNPTYPSALAGEYMGTLDTDVTAIDLNPNRYARAKRADGSFVEDPQGKDFLSNKTLPRRSMETNYYGGLIDEPLLRSLEDRGFNVGKKQGGFAKIGLMPALAGAGYTALSLLNPEEAEAAGLVGMVPTIARKMVDDPNTPKKNNPQGWANYLEKQGAKSTEIDKYNLDLIQTDRQLSKEEVSQYLLDNEYKLGRTLRSQYPTQLDIDVTRANVANELRKQNPDITDAEISESTTFLLDESLPLHMGDRSSGNIENYREQVLEDPSGMQINDYINNNVSAQQRLTGELRELHNAIKSNGFVLDRVGDDLVKVPMDEMVSRYTKKQIQREHLKRLRRQAENRTFVEASHFPELNIAGHVRTTDRINSFDWRTGNKTQYRLIEEVQSDWVQRAENPDVGVKDIEKMDNLYDAMYESKVAQYKAMANASPDKKEDVFSEYLVEQADISRRLEALGTNNFRSKVPQPPIAKPHIPLVNQTIIDAVEEGMDGIGIVTGETQLVAKDQFQFINDISWKKHKIEGDKEPNILFDFSGITNRQGDVGEVHTQLSMNVKSDLEDFRKLLPKGKADEIIDQVRADIAAGKESGIMSNFNAQVEGKKLRPYYNKTLRKHLEQLGKQYGVKVEKRKNTEEFRIESDDGYHSVVREDGVVMEEFDNLREAQEYYDKRMMAVDDHFYLPFTDKMKEDVKKNGLKLFSVAGLTPVAIDAMRASLNNQDEKLQFIYDDRYTQREENRAAIEDMLARDAKQDKVDGILNTISNVAAFPAAVGEGLTESVLEAASFIPETFATAGEYLSGDPESKNYRENVRGLLNPEVEASSERSRMLRDKMAQNFRVNTGNLYDAAEPYLKALLEQDMLPQSVLEQSSMADAMRGIRSAYRNMDAGYLKDNLIPAAGYGILGALGALDFYRRGLVNRPLEGELIPPQQTLQQPAAGLLDRPFIDAEDYLPQGLLN